MNIMPAVQLCSTMSQRYQSLSFYSRYIENKRRFRICFQLAVLTFKSPGFCIQIIETVQVFAAIGCLSNGGAQHLFRLLYQALLNPL